MSNGHAQAGGEFFFRQAAVFEEFFHKLFIVFGCGLDDGVVHLLGAFFFAFGDGLFLGLAAFGREDVHHHAQGIYNGVEALTLIEGILEGNDFACSKAFFGLLQRGVVVGLIVVELIDDKEHGRMHLLAKVPDEFGAYFYAAACVEQHQAGIGHFEGGSHFAHEVVEAGCVEDIDFGVFPGGMHQCGEDGVAAFLFDVGVIRLGVLFINAASSGDFAGFEEHALGQDGLAGARVP